MWASRNRSHHWRNISGPEAERYSSPLGADWTITRPDGIRELDVRVTLKTDSGGLICMSYRGIDNTRSQKANLSLHPNIISERPQSLKPLHRARDGSTTSRRSAPVGKQLADPSRRPSQSSERPRISPKPTSTWTIGSSRHGNTSH